MVTLGSERDRARALHRENAQVSREATMAQKELMSLEAKVFHAGKEVTGFSWRYLRPQCSGGGLCWP